MQEALERVPWGLGKVAQVRAPAASPATRLLCLSALLKCTAVVQLPVASQWSGAQVMLLWLLVFWLLAHGAIPGVLDMLGLEREELASHGQVTLAATHWRRLGRHPGRPRARAILLGGRTGGNAMHAVTWRCPCA